MIDIDKLMHTYIHICVCYCIIRKANFSQLRQKFTCWRHNTFIKENSDGVACTLTYMIWAPSDALWPMHLLHHSFPFLAHFQVSLCTSTHTIHRQQLVVM